ncbi:hypothetical protein F0U44_12720 [Nocardioides humilatus]|uniref:DUF7064 domain-containing protein n=1 Tax=Nocardioides humilatus TaxID=2607660 RepID=A0A5B1LF88_9ACTN|nr:hypothetical protein [Nocardioides humilatus]KAA1419303.1 hypothetical protein F0U44_12720 [Nocardioides humilatus]
MRLEPADELCHPPGAEGNFNESMYANVMAGDQGLGVWVRVGNRPGEGYAEVTCCVYLPDGRVAFAFARAEIDDPTRLAAGGAAFEVVEPFAHVRISYEGPLWVLDDPDLMADPAKAFATSPRVEGSIALDLHGLAVPYGGEPDGSEPETEVSSLLAEFARGHYEQHVRGVGHVRVGEESFEVDGLGLRDHSWGPRYWQNVRWYRFLPLAFGPDFAMCPVLVGGPDGAAHPAGMVLRPGADGVASYVPIEDLTFTSDYDDQHRAVRQRITVVTAERSYEVVGEALTLLPLRNRRTATDGTPLETRITEAMSRFECDGRVGHGMSEYLDQMVDGRPVGRAW